jgi:hypothetical protein
MLDFHKEVMVFFGLDHREQGSDSVNREVAPQELLTYLLV